MNETTETLIEYGQSDDTILGQIVLIVAGVVLVANVITMMTPTRSDNVFMDKVLAFLNAVSLNVLKNKNKDAEH